MSNSSNNNNAIVEEFIAFMKAHTVFKNKETGEKPKNVTHTLMAPLHEKKHPYRGSFSISGNDYNKFLKLYKSVIGKMPLFLVERPKETGKMTGPLIIDIDFKTPNEDREYTTELIENIIEICNSHFGKYLDIDKSDIVAYVQEKKEPTFDKSKNNYKDGFHIFYDIPLSYNKRKFFFDKIKEDIEEKNLFGDIDTDSPYKDIVDEHVLIDNGVLMFGSTKEGREPYELTHVYGYDLEEFPLEEYQDADNLIDLFSLQKYTDDDIVEFKNKYRNKEKEIEERDLEKEKEKKKEKILENLLKNKKGGDKDTGNKTGEIDLSHLSDDHKMVYDYVNIMSKKRATDYESWRNVCWALHNVSPKLYNVFLHFSKKGENFDEEGCQKFWDNANRTKSGYTIASIKMWAKEDNKVEYNKIKWARLRKLMDHIDTPNDNDMADLIVEMYGDSYKCVNITKNTWYEFQENNWVVVDSAYTLLEKIANEVADEFTRGFALLIMETTTPEGKMQGDGSVRNMQKLASVVSQLKNLKTGTTYVKTCARKLYDSKFEETLDANPHLIGFDNGVYDLKANIFRQGVPDDRLTMSVGYDYIHNVSKKVVNEIHSFIKKIQPEDDMRDYVHRYFASCLDGKNRDQSFRMFTGSGGNGKSVLVKLIELTFGEYYGILPAAVLTMKDNGPNNASPFMADTRGKRCVFIHETETDAVIQLGKMKGITGGDKITTRKLFGDPFGFTPQFKLALVCNKLPKIPSDDGGTWRRIRVTPFESKFVEADKVNENKHHYLRDKSLDEEKLSEWSQTYMWMLIHEFYPKYIKDGLCEPKKVTQFSDRYREGSDVIFEFLKETTYAGDEDADWIDVPYLFKLLKEWYKGNNNSRLEYSKKDFEEYLTDKRGLTIIDCKVYGLKCKLLDQEK